MMIVATSKDGIKRRVIFNQEILLVEGSDRLSFTIKDQTFESTMNFTFSDDGEEGKITGTLSDDGKTLDAVLHKWDNGLGVEVTKPIETIALNGKKIWIKFRTIANTSSLLRAFHLTVWVEE